jgi:hypothetical protein
MTRLTTWASSSSSDHLPDSDIRAVCDSLVVGLHYYVPRALATEVWNFHGFDVVPGGVLLTAQPRPLFIMWHMDDLYGEGLAVISGDDYSDWVTDLDLVEAPSETSFTRMQGLLNRHLSRVAVAWQQASSQADPSGDWKTVWALTLGAGAASVTFALGAAGESGDALTYQPDSLAVISDAELARDYRPITATSSAFGQTIWQSRADEISM